MVKCIQGNVGEGGPCESSTKFRAERDGLVWVGIEESTDEKQTLEW